MASNDDGNPAAPYFPSAEAHWREKRQALMERVADGKRAFPLGKADIAPEMDRLASEIKRLEESNHSLAATVKDFQLRLSQKKSQSQREFKQSDELKKKLVRMQTSEQSLLNELEFFETEKLRLEESLSHLTKGLEANISALDNSVKDIGFMKGETGALIEKMTLLENEIPEKNIDMENLDGIIGGTIKALQTLYERMQIIETNVKKTYYKKKKN